MTRRHSGPRRCKAHYGLAARRAAGARPPTSAARLSTLRSGAPAGDEIFGAGLFGPAELAELPDEAVAGSIGCANPVALARFDPARTSSTSVPAAGSTSCSPPAGSGPPAGPTAST